MKRKRDLDTLSCIPKTLFCLILDFLDDLTKVRSVSHETVERVTPLIFWRRPVKHGTMKKWCPFQCPIPEEIVEVRYKWHDFDIWSIGTLPNSILRIRNANPILIHWWVGDKFVNITGLDNDKLKKMDPILPVRLQELDFSDRFNLPLFPAFLPASLHKLTFSSDYKFCVDHLQRDGLQIVFRKKLQLDQENDHDNQ